MRESQKRLATFAIWVIAALPVHSVKVTAHTFVPMPAVKAMVEAASGAATPSPAIQKNNSDLRVRVSAYAAVPKCTKRKNPHITASGYKIKSRDHYRLIALSPDLARNFKFGDLFRLEVGGKSYLVSYRDKMPDRHKKAIDFLLPTVKKCKQFGVVTGKLCPVEKHGEQSKDGPGTTTAILSRRPVLPQNVLQFVLNRELPD